MLYVVIKSDKNKTDEQAILDTEVAVQGIGVDAAKSIVWQSEYSHNSASDLADVVRPLKPSKTDYVILVNPGAVIDKTLVDNVMRQVDAAPQSKKVISLKGDKSGSWNGIAPFFIQFQILTNLNFDFESFDQDSQSRFFAEAVRLVPDYSTAILDTITLPKVERVDRLSSDNPNLYRKSWYFDFQKKWLKTLKSFDGTVPDVVQIAYLFNLQYRIINNANGANKSVLTGADLDKFFEYTAKNLAFIDDNILIDRIRQYSKYIKLNTETRLYLLQLKYPVDKVKYKYKEDNVSRFFKGIRLDSAVEKGVVIESMDYRDDTLIIAGYSRFIYDPARSYMVCVAGDSEYQLYDVHRHSGYSIFGRRIQENRTFRVNIPKDVIDRVSEIEFCLQTDDGDTNVKMRLDFTKQMSKLNERVRSYWYVESLNKIVKYYNRAIHIEGGGTVRRIYNEIRYLQDLIVSRDRRGRASVLRVAYFITKPFFRKPIWIFYDKLYKAGDNGEYLYNYALKQDDGIRKVYVMSKSSTDIDRFRRENKPFVLYASLLNKLLFLNSDIVFATHSGQPTFSGLKLEGAYTKDLFDYDVLFIQHGLTIQDQAHFLNRFTDNTKRYFIASHFESKNLLRPSYGYDKSEIMTTGVPRFDGLVSNPQKQILIAPSWRSYLALPGGGKGDARQKNSRFKDSDYFRLYNDLINDSELLDTAERMGYKIVYLLHPVTSSQVDDFNGHDKRASVVASTSDVSYEKMLTESDLMVTDYSGVQFDFAYMKKPILYYHPKELPPTYEEAIYQYDTDALGEIVETHGQLVKKLCEYMNNNCRVPKLYEERMNDFFYNHDHESAKRIYDEAIRFSRGDRRSSHKDELISKYRQVVQDSRYIRHALGGLDGHMYMDSVQAMASWYEKGDRLFEADINEASNGELVLHHTAARLDTEYDERNKNISFEDGRVNFEEFTKKKMFGKYTRSTFSNLVDFMRSNHDAYVLIDSGRKSYEDTRRIYRKIVDSVEGDDDVLQRFIVGGHTTVMMRAVADVYNFSLYNFYYAPDERREVIFKETSNFIKYCEQSGFTSLSIRHDKYTDILASAFKDSQLITYVFTTDEPSESERLVSMGANIIGTNFLE